MHWIDNIHSKKKTYLFEKYLLQLQLRLTDKELKLYTRQKLTKKIKEVWIENKVKQRKGSLRVAIKESLKMKNEVEAKNNESGPDGRSKLKKPSEKKKSAGKKKTSKKANEANVEKVKTLIDPQAPLVNQRRIIHSKLPQIPSQSLESLHEKLPQLKSYPELEGLILTFLRFVLHCFVSNCIVFKSGLVG